MSGGGRGRGGGGGGAGSAGGDGGPLVLIVDPNDDFRTILGTLLIHQGFRALSTPDADEALEWAIARCPSVMVGEHPLPLRDGRLLCAALLEDDRTASIPFVTVTARALPDDLAAARESHHHGVFAKPVQPGQIFDHIRELVQ